MIYNWAQSAPVQHEKETASEILRNTLQSISWTRSSVWTSPQLREATHKDILGKLQTSLLESCQRVGSCLHRHNQHSPSVIATVFITDS